MTNVLKRKSQQKFKNNLKLNENPTYKNLWDAAKSVLRGNFITLHAYIRKEERSLTGNLIFYFKKLEKKNKVNPKQAEGRK